MPRKKQVETNAYGTPRNPKTGRFEKAGLPETCAVAFRVPVAYVKWLDEEGLNRSEFVREAMKREFERRGVDIS